MILLAKHIIIDYVINFNIKNFKRLNKYIKTYTLNLFIYFFDEIKSIYFDNIAVEREKYIRLLYILN